jgi:hypothetical protein
MVLKLLLTAMVTRMMMMMMTMTAKFVLYSKWSSSWMAAGSGQELAGTWLVGQEPHGAA